MPNLTLKNVPASLHRALKNQAKAHHRSLNKEVIATLQATTEKSARPDIAQQLAEAREMRKKFKDVTSLAEIQKFKIAGDDDRRRHEYHLLALDPRSRDDAGGSAVGT
ncbi:MAG: Arc family DNA-binding protein [Chthoniobacterales bacterium]